MSRTSAEVEALRQRVADVSSWYHHIDLGDGVETPGFFRMADYLEHYNFPASLEGKRILDVGAANGFFAATFDKLGAAEVVAIELPRWADHDWTPRYQADYDAKSDAERNEIDRVVMRSGFDTVIEALGCKSVRKVESRIYDMDPDQLGGPFDIVFCGSMLMHVRDPLLGMQRMRACTKQDGRLIISISTCMEDDDRPVARFVGEWNQCNWWQMNPVALKTALTCSDYGSFENEGRFVLENTEKTFKDPTFVCHALPRRPDQD